MPSLPLLAAIVVLLVIAALILSSGGRSFLAFFKLLSAGFSASQALFLRKIAKSAGVADLYQLFRSPAAIDSCTAEILRQSKAQGAGSSKNAQGLLSILYEMRRKIDLSESRKKPGLETTRGIKVGQPLQIVYSGVGTFSSKAIENLPSGLIVDLPRSPSVRSTKIDWNNKPLKVFFYRTDDAGYAFSTSAIPMPHGDRRAALRLKHSDNVTRFQMRQNTRVKCSIPAHAYRLGIDESPSEMESEPGTECVLQDLSGTGAMFQADGEILRGAKIKIQFMIQDEPIIMTGTAKEVNYSALKNTSLVNFECKSIDPAMKNTVLAFVYNVLPKDEPIADADIMAGGGGESLDFE